MSMMIVSTDVDLDSDWDLANAKTFHIVLSLSAGGLQVPQCQQLDFRICLEVLVQYALGKVFGVFAT